MTRARSSLVSVSDTPYYHVISRCVRRAFLCGKDKETGTNHEHRREWVIERLSLLSEAFSVKLCSYAVMSNHYHLVVCLDVETPKTWSIDEVLDRWCLLFKGPQLVQRFRAGGDLSDIEYSALSDYVECYRERLGDLSWYMKCLNEYIARRANEEDECKGHFWEARFKSQALLDEVALITAMGYVDLNPVRSNIAEDIPTSDKTSVQQRYRQVTKAPIENPLPLMPFDSTATYKKSSEIPFNLHDYLELVDWTGRCLRMGKRGAISDSSPSLLLKLGIDAHEWLPTVVELQARYELVMGSPSRMQQFAQMQHKHFHWGYRYARRLYRQTG